MAYLKNGTIYHEIFPSLFNGFASLNLDFSCTIRSKATYEGGLGSKLNCANNEYNNRVALVLKNGLDFASQNYNHHCIGNGS